MGVQTKRVRDANGAVTQLDLTSAVAANRRLDVAQPGDGGGGGLKLVGFSWKKSTAQPVDITISRIDAANASLDIPLETRLGDTGTTGHWRPPQEEMTGYDVGKPSEQGCVGWRIQFSQAAGACAADVQVDFKEV
jgi:hypothetical protein